MKQEQNTTNPYETISWIKLADSMQTIQSFSKLSALPKSNMALASPAELDLLSRIALSDTPLTPLSLSDSMGMKKSAISRLIHSLLERNYIKKIKNPYDKRSYCLALTKIGEIELDKNYRQMLKPVSCIYHSLGEENFYLLLDLLTKANNSLIEHKKNAFSEIELSKNFLPKENSTI